MTSPTIPNIHGLIFDLDGTLINTLEDITHAANQVLTGHGYPGLTEEQMRLLVGTGLSELLAQAANTDDTAVVRKLVDGYRPYYAQCMLDRTHLYPGISDMLNTLHDRKTPMAVLSNKPHEFTRPICEHYLARWNFVEFLGHRPNIPRKPDPTAALQLAQKLQCDPTNIVFVGDSDVDVQTAQNTGMTSVAVTWGLRDRDHLIAAKPDHLIDHPQQLIPLLQAENTA